MEGDLSKPSVAPARRRAENAAGIPWGYGVERITAAAIDPERLYVCWEVTDHAIGHARAALGPAGEGATLHLRIYDVTGRLFDGANSHHYFDQRVDRSDRQWFFTIGRPSSTVVVEIGLRSEEGRFVRIARSRRVEFPRKHPAPFRDPEWMTVRATGQIEHAGTGTPSWPKPPAHHVASGHGAAPAWFSPIPLWVLHDLRIAGDDVRLESWETAWQWADVAEWLDPHWSMTWTAGPFAYPVEVAPPFSQVWRGRSVSYRIGGVTHIVDGPWEVVIRNLAAHGERAILSRWEVVRSWVTRGGHETRSTHPAHATTVGASDLLARGASERAWLGGSQLRLGGGSELFRIGASELRFGGGSERLFAGASDWMMRGASERRLAGASEARLGGSERRLQSSYPE